MENTVISQITTSFVSQLVDVVERTTTLRMRAILSEALGQQPKRGPGRPPSLSTMRTMTTTAPRVAKKMPKQFCPVPKCKNVAAPAFGMVCGAHRDVSKSKIKRFREQRRASKLAGKQ